MWGDRPMPFNEAAKRCTNYGWPVGPTFIIGVSGGPDFIR